MVREAKLTPGPWRVKQNVDDTFKGDYREIVGGTGYHIDGNKPEGFGITGFISEDDARLMVAAPGLLAACRAAWNCIGELPPTQARVEVAQMLQAAIEAAIGEQP